MSTLAKDIKRLSDELLFENRPLCPDEIVALLRAATNIDTMLVAEIGHEFENREAA